MILLRVAIVHTDCLSSGFCLDVSLHSWTKHRKKEQHGASEYIIGFHEVAFLLRKKSGLRVLVAVCVCVRACV